MKLKPCFAIFICFFSLAFSLPAQGYIIFQLTDGRVIFIGDDERENVSIRPGESDHELWFRVFQGPAPGADFVDYFFEDVSGIYADFGGNAIDDTDRLDLLGCVIDGDVTVVGAADSHDLRVTASPFFPSTVRGDLTFVGTSGIDRVLLRGLTLDGSLTVEMKQNIDSVVIEGTEITGDVSLKTGPGNGRLSFLDSNFGGNFYCQTLGGQDEVTIDSCTFEKSTTVLLGNSLDEMLALNSTFRGFVRFDGGDWFDMGNQGGNVYRRSPLISNFENGNFGN